MKLLDLLLQFTGKWAFVFPQERSHQRALTLAFGLLCGVGKRTLTRAISFQGNCQKDWSADYRVFSRSPWDSRGLFHPILEHAIQAHSLTRIVLSVDDTRLWRSGKHLPEAQWHRDPMGPAFHTNLRWGHRFLQASLVLPLYQQDEESSPPNRSAAAGRWPTGRPHGSFTVVATAKSASRNSARSIGRGGARQRAVRLLVVEPVGYRTTKNGRKYYRQPAYLLTTDLITAAEVLLQAYFDRWGIEVNHRDEKEILGVGEAQVWNPHSVRKVPAFLVAMYSWLLLAGLDCYGPQRTQHYEPLPKWRRHAKRPSCLDLVTLLRRQLAENPLKFPTAQDFPSYETMVLAAAA